MRNTIDLQPKEVVLLLIRRSLWAEGARILVWAGLLFFAFLSFFPLLRLLPFGWVVSCVFLVLGAVLAVRWWRKWKHTFLLVTDRRLIDVEQVGFFGREVTDVPFGDIKEICERDVSVFWRFFSVGSLLIVLKPSMGFDVTFFGVKRCADVVKLLNDVQFYVVEGGSGAGFRIKQVE